MSVLDFFAKIADSSAPYVNAAVQGRSAWLEGTAEGEKTEQQRKLEKRRQLIAERAEERARVIHDLEVARADLAKKRGQLAYDQDLGVTPSPEHRLREQNQASEKDALVAAGWSPEDAQMYVRTGLIPETRRERKGGAPPRVPQSSTSAPKKKAVTPTQAADAQNEALQGIRAIMAKPRPDGKPWTDEAAISDLVQHYESQRSTWDATDEKVYQILSDLKFKRGTATPTGGRFGKYQ